MPDPVTVTFGQLSPHWNLLSTNLVGKLDPRSSKAVLEPASIGEQLVLSFTGEPVRRASRLKGGYQTVVPFRNISRNWEVWLGYREVWKLVERNRFLFSSSDLTVFFAAPNSEVFQQVLRAEWVGQEKLADGWFFRPHNAGHPHWQIDVGETLKSDADLVAARELLREPVAKEFGAPETTAIDGAPWDQIGRIHFASAMRPWLDTNLAYGPAEPRSVRAWVLSTVSILQTEFDRL
jgi:hypothetical protein